MNVVSNIKGTISCTYKIYMKQAPINSGLISRIQKQLERGCNSDLHIKLNNCNPHRPS